MDAVKRGLTPGKWMVDILPFRKLMNCLRCRSAPDSPQPVKYVPEWFPGATFRKFASAGKSSLDSSITVPFETVKRSMQVRLHIFLIHVEAARLTRRFLGWRESQGLYGLWVLAEYGRDS